MPHSSLLARLVRPSLRLPRRHAPRRLPCRATAALLVVVALPSLPAIDTDELRLGQGGVHDGAVTLTRSASTSELVLTDAVAGSLTLSDLKHAATSHAALAGLDADDHPHYLDAARHAAAHDATLNNALAAGPDTAGNTSLGAHLADSRLHLRRDAPESISGAWTMLAPFEAAAAFRLSDGGAPGDLALAFARAGADATIAFAATPDRFEVSRPLAVAGSVDLSAPAGARLLLRGWTGTSGEEGRLVLNGDGAADSYVRHTTGGITLVSAGQDAAAFGQSISRVRTMQNWNFGTVGAPAFSWNSDTNTGIYRSAEDHLDAATGGQRAGGFNASGDLDTRGRLVVAGTSTSTFAGGVTASGQVAATGGFAVGAVTWRAGAGTPEGAVSAPVGSLWSRTDGGAGSTFYVKEGGGSGPTGWVAK